MAQTDEDTARLIAGAQQGDPDCFDGLIDAYAGRVYGYFYRLTRHPAEAEDLLQEVFLRLVQSIGRYDHRSRFESFLFRIAGNLYRDRLRCAQRSGKTMSLSEGPDTESDGDGWGSVVTGTSGPEARLELAEHVQQMHAALALLPTGEQEVIALRHFSGLSFKDIAEVMDIPLGTALARAHRGLAKLKDMLSHG